MVPIETRLLTMNDSSPTQRAQARSLSNTAGSSPPGIGFQIEGGPEPFPRLTYREQLQHPRWQRRRLAVLQAADFQCEECGSGEKTLNVHHVHYMLGTMLWDYPLALLECLREGCHKERQKVQQTILLNVATVLRDLKLDELRRQPVYTFFDMEEGQ